jgi:GPH family glycoside/pentoside/hexuronide:cation symporter
MEKKPLSKALKMFYGIGDLGFSLTTAVETYFFMFFLTNIAEFPLTWVATISGTVTIVDAVLSPMYGGVIAGTKPKKWGRNRSWLLMMPPVVVLTLPFVYIRLGTNDLIAVSIIIAAFVISHICYNFGWAASLNLIIVLAANPRERGMLASRRAQYQAIAVIAFSYTGVTLVSFFGRILGNPASGYPATAFCMACILWIGYIILFRLTEGYEDTGGGPAGKAVHKEKVTFSEMIQSITGNPHVIFLLAGDFFFLMHHNIYVPAVAFYFTYIAKDMKLMPLYVLISSITQLLGATAAGQLSKRFSHRTLALSGLAFGGVVLILANYTGFFIPAVFILGMLARVCYGAIRSWIVAMYAEASVYSEWKTGKNSSPFIMGISNLSGKMSIVTRGVVIPIILGLVGFAPGVDPALVTREVQGGILKAMFLIPGIVLLVSFVIIFFGFRLNNEKLEEFQNEINERKVKAAQAV